MQSVDEFTPSTTEPVFGSGLISQTKNQSSTNNDSNGDNENVVPSSASTVNGQNDNKMEVNESITNGTTANSSTNESSNVHVNGQNEKPIVDEVPAVATEKSNEVEPMVTEAPPAQAESTISSTEPEPAISTTSTDTAMESSSAVTSTEPTPVTEATTTTPAVEAASSNDAVPETSEATASETTEVKTRTPRGRAKAPAVTTTPTPTRQSSRGRKPAASSTTNVEENQSNEDNGTTPVSSQEEITKPTKRQTPKNVKEAVTADNQPNSTSDVSNVEVENNQQVTATDGNVDNDATADTGTNDSPVGRKKRGPSAVVTSTAKKARGKNSITSLDDVDNGAGTSEGEAIQSPPKKARTSAPKKTPEPPSEEYARKLRPRK